MGSNSFPTKENRVGEIFIIVIIKQNTIILAKVCILLNKAFARFYNNAELFKHFVLITHDQGEKLRYENEVNAHVWRLFVF